MDNNENTITLVDEEGQEQDFEIIMTLDVEEEEYAILLPIDAGEEDDAYAFKIIEDEEGYILVSIENDEEYHNVVAAYETIVQDENL